MEIVVAAIHRRLRRIRGGTPRRLIDQVLLALAFSFIFIFLLGVVGQGNLRGFAGTVPPDAISGTIDFGQTKAFTSSAGRQIIVSAPFVSPEGEEPAKAKLLFDSEALPAVAEGTHALPFGTLEFSVSYEEVTTCATPPCAPRRVVTFDLSLSGAPLEPIPGTVLKQSWLFREQEKPVVIDGLTYNMSLNASASGSESALIIIDGEEHTAAEGGAFTFGPGLFLELIDYEWIGARQVAVFQASNRLFAPSCDVLGTGQLAVLGAEKACCDGVETPLPDCALYQTGAVVALHCGEYIITCSGGRLVSSLDPVLPGTILPAPDDDPDEYGGVVA